VAKELLPQRPDDAAIATAALIADPQPRFIEPFKRAAIAQQDAMTDFQGFAQGLERKRLSILFTAY